MAEVNDGKKAKIGAGHAAAMLRLGLTETREIFNPSKDSIANTELGLYGTQTQGEIAEARGGPGGGAQQEINTMEGLRAAGEAMAPSQEKDGPSQDRGR